MQKALHANGSETGSATEHEGKYVFNNGIAPFILEWLRCRFLPDPEFPASLVTSIYFDTRNWDSLREKINSDYFKTKMRLRWYADVDTGEMEEKSFLEVKYKVGGRRRKIRKEIDFSGIWLSRVSLESRKLLDIRSLLRAMDVVTKGPVFPVFKIAYMRRRFVEPVTGSRLCLDCDISVPGVNRQMLPRTNPFHLRSGVFEMKGGALELPDVLHQLTALGCRKESFSKFMECYKRIMRTAF